MSVAGTPEPRAHLGKVLVVDDESMVRTACSRILQVEGWDVSVAASGREGLALLDQGVQFDCVVSDVRMPDVDGFEFVATAHQTDEDLPVLLMTGDPSLDGAVKAIDSGAVSYLSKPFSAESLAEAVARAARRHGVARMRRRAEDLLATSVVERAALQERFERALGSLWMAFQPIVDVVQGRVFAYEALLRTNEESLRRPDIFIGVAERLGAVGELGRAVRAAVARAAADAPADALLFVNIHGLELADDQLFDPAAPLSALARRVVIELTERVALDEGAATKRVAQLRALGYRVAIDDLGAGYAALGSLASLEPDVVKLDMSLIRGIDRHQTKRRVVGAISTLCRELGSLVVAEGIENLEELRAVRDAGVELHQGYFLARPGPGFPVPTLPVG